MSKGERWDKVALIDRFEAQNEDQSSLNIFVVVEVQFEDGLEWESREVLSRFSASETELCPNKPIEEASIKDISPQSSNDLVQSGTESKTICSCLKNEG